MQIDQRQRSAWASERIVETIEDYMVHCSVSLRVERTWSEPSPGGLQRKENSKWQL